MVRVESFEGLAAWQKARSLTRAVYAASSQGQFGRDWGLSGQIQRASVSVMSNIAEGFDRYRLAEFHQFLSVAKGSCAEVRSQLFVAKDLGYIDQASFDALMREARDVAKLVGALRVSVLEELRKQKAAEPVRASDERLPLRGLSTQDSGPQRGHRGK